MSYLAGIKKIETKENGLHIIMGDAGAGKTSFSGTYPTPALFIPLGNDGGYKVLEGTEGFDMIDPLRTDKSVVLRKGGLRMYDKLKGALIELYSSLDVLGYKTIVIDPMTEVQADLESVFKKLKGKNLSFDEWSIISELMGDLFKVCEAIAEKINVVLICHTKALESTDTMSDTKITKLIPSFTEGTAKRLTKNADMVMYIGTKKVSDEDGNETYKRYAITGAHPILPTKIRLPRGKSMDNIELYDLSKSALEELIKTL